MSYSDSFPSSSPRFQANFAANGGRIDPRMTFSRSDTPPTYAAPSAVHYWSNEKHLSSENLIPYSNLSSGFTFGQTTLDSSNNSAPDGGSDAVLVLETAVNSKHEIYRSFSCVSGTQYSFLIYVKANGRDKVILKPQLTSVIAQVKFDLTAVTSTVIAGSADSHSITAIGSTGWYKCAVTVTGTATGTGYTQINLADSGGSDTYLGDVTKGVYLWGAQISTTGQTVLNETSGQIHREYAPTLKSVATAGQPRFEYDPSSDGQSMGILIESQSTNLLNRSEEFDNSYWTKYRATITANAAIAPSGELTADLFVSEQTGSAQTHIVQSASHAYTSGTAYTFSVFVKPAGFSKIRIAAANTTTWAAAADYDLSGSGSVSGVTGTASTEDCGNGWFRCILTGTAGATASTPTYVFLDNGSGTSFDGDDYSGVLLWGAQLEQASFPSSYLKVEGSTATRAAESLSVTDSSLFDNGGGTIVAEYDTSSPSAVAGIAAITDGAGSSNAVSLRLQASTAKMFVNNSGSTQAATSTTAPSAGVYQKIAGRYAVDDFGVCVNGGSVVSDSSGSVPVINKLEVGTMDNGSYHLNGHVKRVALYNEALSDTNLQALTS